MLADWDPPSFANGAGYSRKVYIFHGLDAPSEGEMWRDAIHVKSEITPDVMFDHIREAL